MLRFTTGGTRLKISVTNNITCERSDNKVRAKVAWTRQEKR